MENRCLICNIKIPKEHNQKVCIDCRRDYYKDSKLSSAKDWYKKNRNKKKVYDKNLHLKRRNEKLKKMKPKKCVICGKTIFPDNLNLNNFSYKITCSPKCANIHKNNLTSNSLKIEYKYHKKKGICVGCGINKLIYVSYGSNIYCKDCHRLHLERTREYARVKEKRFEIENCIVCNVDIKDRHSKSKYCKKCADKIRELYHKFGIKSKEAVILLRGNFK